MKAAWILGLLTAVWFGAMAVRARESWILWGLGGGLFGLAVTTVVIGLGQAAFIPFSSREANVFQMREVGVAFAIIVIAGCLFTLGLVRRAAAARGRGHDSVS